MVSRLGTLLSGRCQLVLILAGYPVDGSDGSERRRRSDDMTAFQNPEDIFNLNRYTRTNILL